MSYSSQIILRLLAATLGAYMVSAAASFALVPLLQLGGVSLLSDAVYYSVMLAYLVFFLLVIACFAMASVLRVYLLLLCMALVSSVIHMLGAG